MDWFIAGAAGYIMSEWAESIIKKDNLRLIEASKTGDINTVKEILSENRKLEEHRGYKDDYGKTALMHAAKKGQLEIVREICSNKHLGEKKNINSQDNKGKHALIYAAKKGHLEIVKELLNRGADMNNKDHYGFTALMYAVEKGHLEIVKELLNRGAHPNIQYDPNMQNKKGFTALMSAAEKGHLEIVKELINRGADPNIQDKKGWTAAQCAGEGKYLEILYVLYKIPRNLIDIEKKEYCMIQGCKNGDYIVVEFLLYEHNVDPNLRERGETLVRMACKSRNPVTALPLINKGATASEEDIMNIMNDKNSISLHEYGAIIMRWACRNRNEFFLSVMLAGGIKPNNSDRFGNTPIMLAEMQDWKEGVKLLLEYGSKKSDYQILGISRNATDKEINRAFRKLSLLYHPDKGGNKEQFQEINNAFQNISNYRDFRYGSMKKKRSVKKKRSMKKK